MVDIDAFTVEYITGRNESLCKADIEKNHDSIKKALSNRKVLVIGGAGSIGSSYIKEILKYGIHQLTVVDINENALTELTRGLRSTRKYHVPEDYRSYPMDYSSSVFEKMFRKNGGFDIIANFSAHKHVRSEKDIFSIEALISNNLLNVEKFLQLLCEYPPESYFCVSTDKATNPVNIMGASKRLMEELIFSYSDSFPVKTARFANVAFSNGSLLEGFLKRIEKRQPITAPNDVKRYFVSPQESGQICMISSLLGGNREIVFPKLSKEGMRSFDQIARDLLKCYGFDIKECSSEMEALDISESKSIDEGIYPVYFTKSDTSGEKPFEEFCCSEDKLDISRFSSLGVIKDIPIPDKGSVQELLQSMRYLFNKAEVKKVEVVNLIKGYLPYFEHIETGKSLDQKM